MLEEAFSHHTLETGAFLFLILQIDFSTIFLVIIGGGPSSLIEILAILVNLTFILHNFEPPPLDKKGSYDFTTASMSVCQ